MVGCKWVNVVKYENDMEYYAIISSKFYGHLSVMVNHYFDKSVASIVCCCIRGTCVSHTQPLNSFSYPSLVLIRAQAGQK